MYDAIESNVWHQPARDQINEKKDETDVITNIHERNNMVELVPKQSSSTCKAMISGDSSVTSAGLINVDYDGINMYLNKDFDEITGDAQQYKVPTFLTDQYYKVIYNQTCC